MNNMIENIEDVIKKNIRIARKSNGLTLKKEAEFLGFSETNLLNIEKGRTRISAGDLYRISVICDVDIKDLYDPNFITKHVDSQKIISDYKKAVEEEERRNNSMKLYGTDDKNPRQQNITRNRLIRKEI